MSINSVSYIDDTLWYKEKPTESNNEKESIVESLMLSDYKKNIQAWKDFFSEIKGDHLAIERKIQSFENKKLSWKFIYLDTLIDADDEKLEDEYLKYFEPQTSSLYLGWLLIALDHEAFQNWFFDEMEWIQESEVEEKRIQRIHVLDRLVSVAERLDKENKCKIRKEELYK